MSCEVFRDHQSLQYFVQRDLNLRQRWQLELLKDYDITILYHPKKMFRPWPVVFSCTVSPSSLFEHIRECQFDDPHLLVLKDTVQHGGAKQVSIGDDRVLRMRDWSCVPNVDGLRELILEEAHSLLYFIHPGAAKM
ncbi:uncharacterized protein [Nicotiana tomentosiformis]|uniref:uncharacterized protein n=1 Tax=Nicotiana tomentosiformis TaxID=4098 RepID=UPI00388CBDA3